MLCYFLVVQLFRPVLERLFRDERVNSRLDFQQLAPAAVHSVLAFLRDPWPLVSVHHLEVVQIVSSFWKGITQKSIVTWWRHKSEKLTFLVDYQHCHSCPQHFAVWFPRVSNRLHIWFWHPPYGQCPPVFEPPLGPSGMSPLLSAKI